MADKLAYTYDIYIAAPAGQAHWDASVEDDRPSRVTCELHAVGPSTTRLRIVHEDFDGPTATYTGGIEGWPLMMSSLKSLLETGKPLATI